MRVQRIYKASAYLYDRSSGAHSLVPQVDFDPRLVNSVGVLGNLGQPFSLRRLPNGMCVGSSTLAVRNAKRETDWCAACLLHACMHTKHRTWPNYHQQCTQVQPGGVERACGARGDRVAEGHPSAGGVVALLPSADSG